MSDLPHEEFDARICLLSGNQRNRQLLQENGGCVFLARDGRHTDGWTLWPLARQIHAFKPDLIHLWDASANHFGLPVARLCRTKTIFCSRYEVYPPTTKWGFGIDRMLASSLTKVIVPSCSIGETAGLRINPDDEKLDVIPPAIPNTNAPTISRSALLQKLRLPKSCRLIATSDPLEFGNRVRDIIWATELLKVANHEVHVFIYGDGPQREALERFRNHVHLQDRIHFLSDHQLIAETIQHLDLFWKVNGNAGTVNRILEAMRSGIPVIADDAPANRECIQHEETGYLLPIGNRAALASVTHELLKNFDRAKKVGAAAQAAIKNSYDPKLTLAKHISLYRENLGIDSLSCTNTPKP